MAYTLSERDFDKIYVLYQHISSTKHLYNTMSQNQLDCVARIVGNSIHDVSKIWSGYISVNGLHQIIQGKETFTSLATDHYNSRLQSGKHIVSLFNNNQHITFDNFTNVILQACFVHKILRSENTRLVKAQSSGNTWSKCYIDCGIDLIFLGDEHGILPKRITKTYLKQYVKKEED